MTISSKLPKGTYFVVDIECVSSYLADNVNIQSFDQLDSAKLVNALILRIEFHMYTKYLNMVGFFLH